MDHSTLKEKPKLDNEHYLIGIGASAGGLLAINDLFDTMPSNTGFSFIIIQHLSPDYKSLMGELLSKHTSMHVFEAENNIIPQPDSIYLIPPKKIITIEDGRLKLEEKIRDHHPNTAIDIFFESLATNSREKAVGIILSGTGTDGTKGIQAIKNHGGTVIVQDPITAQFDGMPNSAVASGYVDIILPPDIIAEELIDFIKEAPLVRSFNALNNQDEAAVLDILELVYKTTNHDFSNYKRPTINRRLAKRMGESSIKSLADYLSYLKNNPGEVKQLCKEFLLHVTRFFRDEEAFDILGGKVIPEIIEKKVAGDVLKVWTVACSTGEEAYSIAMLFDECLGHDKGIEVKIFASDISQAVIDIASRGIYSEEHVKNLSEERLKKHFVKESGGYRIAPSLRKMIVFAKHDISKDPPFGKIDLISCRNMLIYMNPVLQKTILQKFHFSVNEEGYLFLGASENIGVLKDVMIEVDKKWKLFQCISKTRVADPETFSHSYDRNYPVNPSTTPKAKNALAHLSEVFKETLLEEYDYAGIFIDRDFEVKQAIGNFKKFIDFPEGNFNFNLLKLVPPDLFVVMSTAIRKAIKDNEKVVHKNIKVQRGKVEKSITIIVKPYLTQKVYMQPFIFIVMKEEPVEVVALSTANFTMEGYETEKLKMLDHELRETKETLQALIEEVESANEELQSSNEEIVSSNEELQSTNEELQSLNEELHTVNVEHQLKIKELIDLNDDLNNYFNNTDIGQILIDKDLVIRKFSPVATRQVNLKGGDVGRSIVDISTNMINLDFINDIKSVLKNGKLLEKEVRQDDQRIFQMRIAPFLRLNKLMDGVVISFVDITEVKKLNNILKAVFNSSTSGILALKAIRNAERSIVDFEVIAANDASIQLLNLGKDIIGKPLSGSYAYIDPENLKAYISVVEMGKTASFEYFHKAKTRWFEIIGVKMMDGLVITFNDITDRKRDTEQIGLNYEALKLTSSQLEFSNFQLAQSNFDLLQFASVASHDLKEPLRKIQVFGTLLRQRAIQKLDESESNYLDKIVKSSHRMQTLIEDILTLSRLSKNDTPHTQIDLINLVAQIQDDLEISIKEKDAQFIVKDLPTVWGIAGQMHQLFQNLISNAIKFNDGRPIITIESKEVLPEMAKEFSIDSSQYFCITVTDNGIGFEEDYSEKIFGLFQRLDKTNYQGTGIGLAIVKKIIDNHKGFIKASSKPGEGANFIILLPKQKLIVDHEV